jgi:uncharacterized protein
MACADATTPSVLNIEVVYCAAAGQTDTVKLMLPAPATLLSALSQSHLLARHALLLDAVRVGVWGRVQTLDAALRDGDRVEIYRPLTVDPKEARRLRYKRHRQNLPVSGKPR